MQSQNTKNKTQSYESNTVIGKKALYYPPALEAPTPPTVTRFGDTKKTKGTKKSTQIYLNLGYLPIMYQIVESDSVT